MSEEETLSKIQAIADESAKKYISKSDLELIYSDKLKDGSIEHFVLGRDMPHLIFRIFKEDKNGKIEEINDIQYTSKRSAEYEREIKPGLKLVPPSVMESSDYRIMTENKLVNGALEIKLRSSSSRDITMIESFRYFDYISKVFFVGCVGTSFGGLFIFSVISDGNIMRLITNPNEGVIKDRIPMLTELLNAGLLPSYQSIEVANKLLLNPKEERPRIKLRSNSGDEEEFETNFCYDDYESRTRFAFFVKVKEPEKGVVLICNPFDNNKLTTSNEWDENQKKAGERILKLFETNKEEFNKHVCPLFVDNLDFRYSLFKEGKLVGRNNPNNDNNNQEEPKAKKINTKKAKKK